MGNSSLSKPRSRGGGAGLSQRLFVAAPEPGMEQGDGHAQSPHTLDPSLPCARVVVGSPATTKCQPVVVVAADAYICKPTPFAPAHQVHSGSSSSSLRPFPSTGHEEKAAQNEWTVGEDGHMVYTAAQHSRAEVCTAAGRRSALPLLRCSRCAQYIATAEFTTTSCVYHPKRYTPGKWCRWECCKATGRDAPGCTTRCQHTEDTEFSALAQKLGCELTPQQLQRREEKLATTFGAAWGCDGTIRVMVHHQDRSQLLQVPWLGADVGSLKAILASAHPELAGRRAESLELGECAVQPLTPVSPLHDTLALTDLSSEVIDAGACSKHGAIDLFVLAPPRAHRTGAGAGSARGPDWVRVQLRMGDTLTKLALQYNLDAATIKSANGIVGSEIEAWRDELWLPPLAGSLHPPPLTLEVVADPSRLFHRELRIHRTQQQQQQQMGAAPMAATTSETPSQPEIDAYMALHDGDISAAVAAFHEDAAWAAAQPAPQWTAMAATGRSGSASHTRRRSRNAQRMSMFV
jgi:hypothetical protein